MRRIARYKFLLAASAAWVCLWLSPLRGILESDMALHMMVQLPLLIAIGFMLATVLGPHEPRWFVNADWLGIPSLLLVIFTTSIWMLPRMLDLALGNIWIDLLKFASLPLLAGLPLGLSWPRVPALGRAFLWANLISMLATMGGLYLGAPQRLCAYYRLDQQTTAGTTLIAIAVVLGLSWFIVLFIGAPSFPERHRKIRVRRAHGGSPAFPRN
ncbi:MAG: hypothetical protein ACREDL_18665 [Bradyrhizobium sp.]